MSDPLSSQIQERVISYLTQFAYNAELAGPFEAERFYAIYQSCIDQHDEIGIAAFHQESRLLKLIIRAAVNSHSSQHLETLLATRKLDANALRYAFELLISPVGFFMPPQFIKKSAC